MNSFVLDASVAAKWFLPAAEEPFSTEAQDLLVDFAEGSLTLIVPDLFWPELGNILWKCARVGRISSDTAVKAMKELDRHHIPTFPSQPLTQDALEISLRFAHPVYDAIYVALAVHKASPLITADERLTRALGTYFPIQDLASRRASQGIRRLLKARVPRR